MDECFARHGFRRRGTRIVTRCLFLTRATARVGRAGPGCRVPSTSCRCPRGRAERAHLSTQRRLLLELTNALSGRTSAGEVGVLPATNGYPGSWVERHSYRIADASADASGAYVPLVLAWPSVGSCSQCRSRAGYRQTGCSRTRARGTSWRRCRRA